MASPRRSAGRCLLLALPVAGSLVALAAPAHAAPAPCPSTAPPEAVESGDATAAESYAIAGSGDPESMSSGSESWVATDEPVVVDDPAGEPGDPPPPSQCEPPGDPGEEKPVVPSPESAAETVAASDGPAVVGAPAAGGHARQVRASEAESDSAEDTRPLELPRFVARTILSPLFAHGLNPLLAFVLGAAALVAYATLAAGATRHRVFA